MSAPVSKICRENDDRKQPVDDVPWELPQAPVRVPVLADALRAFEDLPRFRGNDLAKALHLVR